jgi:hypothetical protein
MGDPMSAVPGLRSGKVHAPFPIARFSSLVLQARGRRFLIVHHGHALPHPDEEEPKDP